MVWPVHVLEICHVWFGLHALEICSAAVVHWCTLHNTGLWWHACTTPAGTMWLWKWRPARSPSCLQPKAPRPPWWPFPHQVSLLSLLSHLGSKPGSSALQDSCRPACCEAAPLMLPAPAPPSSLIRWSYHFSCSYSAPCRGAARAGQLLCAVRPRWPACQARQTQEGQQQCRRQCKGSSPGVVGPAGSAGQQRSIRARAVGARS